MRHASINSSKGDIQSIFTVTRSVSSTYVLILLKVFWRNSGQSFKRLIPPAFIARSSSRNRATATANGLMSTPWMLSNVRWARSLELPEGFFFSHRSKMRSKALSRKWPDPQAGS